MLQISDIPAAPGRPADSHKGTFGTVIVVAGSATMIGAPAMCAHAAFRGGAGRVKIATRSEVLTHAIVIEPSATGIALPGDVKEQVRAIDLGDPKKEAVLAVGPGIGQAEDAGGLVLALLHGSRRIVLDADGLNLLAATGKPAPAGGRARESLVLTPHPGEFARLAKPMGIAASPTDPQQRPEAAVQLARAHDAVVVLKGHRTIVTDGEDVFTNHTGNPALATAGSGDVLTGLLAALIAQGMAAFDAAILAAHIHGAAADAWAERHGPVGLLARDLADGLPDALRRC